MPVWGWIIAAIGVLALIGIGWAMWSRRRTHRLQGQFGPEYDRAIREKGKRRDAESELTARRKRREGMEIRPLAPQSRERYVVAWRATQERFVDAPGQAVHEADALVLDVMRERGYPMENFEQRSADVSVDHPDVVENYRAAHGISLANEQGRASTEDLRQAMVHYRTLFEVLLRDEGQNARRAQEA